MSTPVTAQHSAAREVRVKSTDIPWAGEIPSHWRVMGVKRLARRGRKTFTDGDWIESPYITDSGVRLIQTGNVGLGEYHEQGFRYISEESFKALGCTEVEAGDVLICRLGEPLACACLAPQLPSKMITSVDVCILKPSEDHDPSYLVRLMSSPRYLGWVNSLCRGSTRDRISRSMLGAFLLPIPPATEQRRIAGYLDEATGKVDRLVALRRRQMELLREQRAALIQQAVTRGLNPNAPLKESSLPWLGQIPKHWQCSSLRRFWSVTDCKHLTVPFLDEGVPLASVSEVQSFELDLSQAKRTSEDFYRVLIEADRQPRRGDVIYCRNTSVGAAAYVPNDEPLAMGQDVCLIRSAKQNGRYLVYQLRAAFMTEQLNTILVGATFKRINVADIKALAVVCPPKKEQDGIVDFLDAEGARTDRLLAAYTRQLELLTEYRAALIHECVTGQRAVPS